MLPTFEGYTMPLTSEEKAYARQILSIWEPNQGRICCIDKQIIPFLTQKYGIDLGRHRIQKILSTIRKAGAQWHSKILISTGLGYYWSDDIDDIETYCKTNEMRVDSITALNAAAKEYLANRRQFDDTIISPLT